MDDPKTARRGLLRTKSSCSVTFTPSRCQVEFAYRLRRVVDPCGADALPDPCEPKGFFAPGVTVTPPEIPRVVAAIHVVNAAQTSQCPEGLRDNTGAVDREGYSGTLAAVTYGAALIAADVRLADLPDVRDNQRVRWAGLSQEELDACVAMDEAELTAFLLLDATQAATLMEVLADAEDLVNGEALDSAERLRVCEAWNDAGFFRCPSTSMWPEPAPPDWFILEDGSSAGLVEGNDLTGNTYVLHDGNIAGPGKTPFEGENSGTVSGRPVDLADDGSALPFSFHARLVLSASPVETVDHDQIGGGLILMSHSGDAQLGHFAALIRNGITGVWYILSRDAESGLPDVQSLGTYAGFPAWIRATYAEDGDIVFQRKTLESDSWVDVGSPVNVGTQIRYAGIYAFTGVYGSLGHEFNNLSEFFTSRYAPYVSVAAGAFRSTLVSEDVNAPKEEANKAAHRSALLSLRCHFGNDEISAHCPSGIGSATYDPETYAGIFTAPSPTSALGPEDGYVNKSTVPVDTIQAALDIDLFLAEDDFGENVSKSWVNEQAEAAASAGLVAAGCNYTNDEQSSTCYFQLTGSNTPTASVGGGSTLTGTTTPGATIERLGIISTVGVEDANVDALLALAAALDCYWRSDAATGGCPDVVLAYDQATETWTEDPDGGYTFTALFGSVTFLQGAFVSYISLEDANTQRDAAAAAAAACGYGNKALGARCLSKANEYSSAIPADYVVRSTALGAQQEAQALSRTPSSVRGDAPGHSGVVGVVPLSSAQPCTYGSRPVVALCVTDAAVVSQYPESDVDIASSSPLGLVSNASVRFPSSAVEQVFTHGSPPSDQNALVDLLTVTALAAAKASRTCSFSSPTMRLYCDAPTTVPPDALSTLVSMEQTLVLPLDPEAPFRYNVKSIGSAAQPVVMPKGSVTSAISFADACQQALLLGRQSLNCFFSSPRVEIECGQWDTKDMTGTANVTNQYGEGGSARAAYRSDQHLVKGSTGEASGPPSRAAVITSWDTSDLSDSQFAAIQASIDNAFLGTGTLENVFSEPKNLNVVTDDETGADVKRLFTLDAGAFVVSAGPGVTYDTVVQQAILQAKALTSCRYTHTSAIWVCGGAPTNLSNRNSATRIKGVRRMASNTIISDAVIAGTFVSSVSQLDAQRRANVALQQKWQETFSKAAYGCNGEIKLVVKGTNMLCTKEVKGIGTEPEPAILNCPLPAVLEAATEQERSEVRKGTGAGKGKPATNPEPTTIRINAPSVYTLDYSASLDYDIGSTEKIVPNTVVRIILGLGGSLESGSEIQHTMPGVLNLASLLWTGDPPNDKVEKKFPVTGCAGPGTGGGGSSASSGGSGSGSDCGIVTIPAIRRYEHTPSAPVTIKGTYMIHVKENSAGVFIATGKDGTGMIKPEVQLLANVVAVQDPGPSNPFAGRFLTQDDVKIKITRAQVTMTPGPPPS